MRSVALPPDCKQISQETLLGAAGNGAIPRREARLTDAHLNRLFPSLLSRRERGGEGLESFPKLEGIEIGAAI